MTDKEIIKALECRIKKECTNCPHKKMFCSDTVAMKHALDLTKRQQKEVERLKIENQSLRSAASSYKLHYNKARTEAVKEFAERLKELYTDESITDDTLCFIGVIKQNIDDIAEEMITRKD